MEKTFRAKSPYNVAHLILPKPEGDSWKPYEETRNRLSAWLEEGVILPDERPGIYIYRMIFFEGGEARTNLGFFALGKLEDYLERGVAPHENILAAPREDRLKLRLSTQADFGPVYLLYRDREKVFENLAGTVLLNKPMARVRDWAGASHELWQLTDLSAINEMVSLLAPRPVLIADGHHRYDAALESHRRNPDNSWFACRMMAFFNSEGGGPCIRPIHRLLLPFELSGQELLDRLSASFEVELLHSGSFDYSTSQKDFSAASSHLVEGAENWHRFRLYIKGSMYLVSRPKTENLDIVVLEQAVFKEALGLTDERLKSLLGYSNNALEVAVKVEQGKALACFLLDPPTIDEVWRVVQSGQKLPPKSTFFYPKLLTGLVMNINSEFYK